MRPPPEHRHGGGKLFFFDKLAKVDGEFQGKERHVPGGHEDDAVRRRPESGLESGERPLPDGPGVRDAARAGEFRVRAAVSDDDYLRAKSAKHAMRPLDELHSADIEGELVGSGEPSARTPGEDDAGYFAGSCQWEARVAGFFREEIFALSAFMRCDCEFVHDPREARLASARSTAALCAFRSVSHVEKRPEETSPR